MNLLLSFNNTRLFKHFMTPGGKLDILEPRTPEDIYKTRQENSRGGTVTSTDSAKQYLASSFVNSFINAGFGSDKVMLAVE